MRKMMRRCIAALLAAVLVSGSSMQAFATETVTENVAETEGTVEETLAETEAETEAEREETIAEDVAEEVSTGENTAGEEAGSPEVYNEEPEAVEDTAREEMGVSESPEQAETEEMTENVPETDAVEEIDEEERYADAVESGQCGDNAFWTLDAEGNLSISGTGEVTGSFTSNGSIKSVYISDGITGLVSNQYGTFRFCGNLREIIIPNSMKTIGYGTFCGCSSLTEISIPDGVTSICGAAFSGCSSLAEIYIPTSVRNIDENAFSGCGSLAEIAIPSSVTSIGENAFGGCSNLININIPENITSISDKMFKDCGSLAEITIPSSVTSIGKSAFDSCSRLTEIIIPDGVRSIGDSAFARCSRLTEMIIPGSVTSIGSAAFQGCGSLTEVIIPDKVTSIGGYLFQGCGSLTEVNIQGRVTSIGWRSFWDCHNLTKITIPDSVTSIGDAAFWNCHNLTEVTIPSSVTSIGIDAFKNCLSLTKITIPSSVTSIGVGAFSDCGSLTEVMIFASTKNINNVTFENCKSLVKIVIPDSVTGIGEGAFRNCSSLTEVMIPDSVTGIGADAFRNCGRLTEVTIPDSVRNIGNSAFRDCDSLTEINIPVSVTSIGDTVFSRCSGLRKITIPSSVTSIGEWMFYDCSSLKEVVIPDSVKNIGEGAFNGCSGLRKVTIPSSVKRIGAEAFYNCGNLKKVTIQASECVAWSPSVFSDTKNIVFCVPEGAVGYDAEPWSNCNVVYGDACTLTYNANGGGSAPAAQKGTIGKAFTLSKTVPVRKGYTFLGWAENKTASKASYKAGAAFEAYKNTTLYAVWQPAKYTITYNLNGGTNNTKNPSSYSMSTATFTLQNPSRTGYTFKGWYSDSTYKTKVTQIAKGSTGAKKLYAKWSPNVYTVRYDKNGGTGSMSDSKSLKYGTEYALRANTFQKKGYAFAGWATTKDGKVIYKNNAKIKNLSSKNGSVKILYAKWARAKYAITYNLNGGKNNTKNPSSYYMTTATITLQNPTRAGYTFKGWYADSTYKTKVTRIAKGSTGARKLYAKWSPNLYTIRYDKNGGTGNMSDSKSLKYGTEYTLRTNTFQRKGYTFAGWATARDGAVAYKNKAKVKNLSSKNGAIKILYAKWTKTKYTITYNLNGGKNSTKNPASYNITTATITLQNPTRTGYTFKGWYADSTYKTKVTQIAKGSTGARKLYAKWSPNLYTVRYDKNGGTGSMSDSKSLKYGTEYTLRTNTFQRKGYTFAGWAAAKDGKVSYKDKAKVKNLSSKNGAVKVLYAKWTPIKYTITYNLNGGKNSTKNPASYYVTTATITLQNPTRTGYTFKGWYTDSKYKTKVTQIAKGCTGTKKLYAKWSLNTYTVRYDKNGGTGSMADSTSMKYGTEYTLRANTFQRNGYIFAGWATAKEGEVVYQDKARVKNLSSTNGAVKILYAQWKPVAESITLSVDTAEITVGESIQLIAVIAPDNAADKEITWVSTDNAIAIVDEEGMVEGVGEGTADIIASTANGLEAVCTVTVQSAEPVGNVE